MNRKTTGLISKSQERKKERFLFYTGALVEPQAYAKLADGLAKEGIEVYIISSQLNLPVLDNGTMATIVKEERLDKVFVGGHSLGGVVSTIEAKKLNEIDKISRINFISKLSRSEYRYK